MTRTALLVCICLVGPSGLAETTDIKREAAPAQVPQKETTKERQSMTVQQQLRYSLEKGTLTSRYGVLLTEALWSHIKYTAGRSGAKIIGDPNCFKVRERVARQVLGQELYNDLESHLLKVIESSSRPEDVQVALRMLGRGLTCLRAKPALAQRLRDNLGKLVDDDPANDPNPNTLFHLAEAFAYMGDSSGVVVLDDVLESEAMPAGRKCAAIRALTALATAQAKEILLRRSDELLLSEHATVASCAFRNLQVFDCVTRTLAEAAHQQLRRVAEVQGTTLSKQEQALLLDAHFILYEQIKQNELSEDQRQSIRKATRTIISQKDTESAETVALLFSALAGDEDSSIIGQLLDAESTRLRREGVRSVLKCSQKAQRCFLPNLIALLDDQDAYNRDLALYVIRRYKGEKTVNGLPEEVFEAERDRIKRWWKEEHEKLTD